MDLRSFGAATLLCVLTSCFVNDVVEDTSDAASSGASGPVGPGPGGGGEGPGAGAAGPGPNSSGTGASSSSTSAGGEGGLGPGAGAGPGSGPGPGSGGEGGIGPIAECGDGDVEGDEECESTEPWCVQCKFQCVAGNEAWNPGNGHCYRFVRDADKNFDAANQDCGAWRPGAHLVSITTDAEQSWVTERIDEHIDPFEPTYLGGRRSNGNWAWVSGEPWNFTSWDSGEGNGGNEPCLGMYAEPGPWHDFTCTPNEAYVCEWTPPAP